MRKLLGLIMVLVCLCSAVGCSQGKPAPERPTPEAAPSAPLDVKTALTEPPELMVALISQKEEIKAAKSTYSWTYRKDEETFGSINACGEGMPERLRDMLSSMSLPAAGDPLTAALNFGDAPDSVSVRGWNVNGQGPEHDWEPVEVHSSADEFQIELKDGNYLYEVTAEWNEDGLHWGRAWYHFQTAKQP